MKTIKLTNFEVQSIIRNLSDSDSLLFSNNPDKKLPISILWKIDENVEKLGKINEKILSKRAEIEQLYSDDEHSYNEVVEKENVIRKVKPEYSMKFNTEINELMNIVNEIDICTLDISLFNDCELVPKDYRSIRFMLESNEDKEENNETEKDNEK